MVTNDNSKPNIQERTFKFGVRIVKMVSFLPKTPAGFAVANQVVRSGTSIGANIQEAQGAQSKKDFIHCMQISLKEARETYYWIRVIIESDLLSEDRLAGLLLESEEIVKILVVIVKKSKEN